MGSKVSRNHAKSIQRSKSRPWQNFYFTLGIKGDEGYINGLVRVLSIAADVIRESREASCDRKRYYEILTQKHRNYFCDTPDDEKPAIYKFDNYLFCWALKIWPRALDIIRERERCRR